MLVKGKRLFSDEKQVALVHSHHLHKKIPRNDETSSQGILALKDGDLRLGLRQRKLKNFRARWHSFTLTICTKKSPDTTKRRLREFWRRRRDLNSCHHYWCYSLSRGAPWATWVLLRASNAILLYHIFFWMSKFFKGKNKNVSAFFKMSFARGKVGNSSKIAHIEKVFAKSFAVLIKNKTKMTIKMKKRRTQSCEKEKSMLK